MQIIDFQNPIKGERDYIGFSGNYAVIAHGFGPVETLLTALCDTDFDNTDSHKCGICGKALNDYGLCEATPPHAIDWTSLPDESVPGDDGESYTHYLATEDKADASILTLVVQRYGLRRAA